MKSSTRCRLLYAVLQIFSLLLFLFCCSLLGPAGCLAAGLACHGPSSFPKRFPSFQYSIGTPCCQTTPGLTLSILPQTWASTFHLYPMKDTQLRRLYNAIDYYRE